MTISALDEGGHASFHAFVADISDRLAGRTGAPAPLRGTAGRAARDRAAARGRLDALADAVTIRGSDDRLLYANRAALDRMGLASVEEIAAADPRELMGR